MKLNVLTDYIAMNPEIKKIYIIGQDYSFGQVVSDTSIELLREKRPDIEIVGNEFHPIGQVKDFTPYVTKIVSSDADAVITGNFGADMVSLARSIIDSGLDIPIYTFYAAYDGITATLGADGVDKIYLVHNDAGNPLPSEERLAYTRNFKRLNPNNDMTQFRITNALQMLVQAMEASQSTDPYDIALALEDMRFTNMSGEELWMRGEDHQIIQPLHISVHTDQNIVVDADNSGFGLYRISRWPETRRWSITAAACAGHAAKANNRWSRRIMLEVFVFSTLNGLVTGLLLFMLASGLTLIFSMMGVLNFAHASFYMLGAYFAYSISLKLGFWAGLLLRRYWLGH